MSDFHLILNPQNTTGEFSIQHDGASKRGTVDQTTAKSARLRYDIEESCFIMFNKIVLGDSWDTIRLAFSTRFPEGQRRRCRATFSTDDETLLSAEYGSRSRSALECEYLRLRGVWGLKRVRADADIEATKRKVVEKLKLYGYWPEPASHL